MWAAAYVNCLGHGNAGGDFGRTGSETLTLNNCASSDGTADDFTGTGNRVNQTFTFVNHDGNDFHLAAGDTGAKGYGVTNPGSGLFSDDVDSQTRVAPWDIGFDQCVYPDADPLLISLTPNSGSIGDQVTIAGSNFGSAQGTVTFNGLSASITSWAANQIVTRVPENASTGPVVVHTAAGKISNGVTFTVSTIAQKGALQVTLGPSAAVTAGAQWNVDSGAWQDSEATVSGLSVGLHTVNYKSVIGWDAPASEQVIIASGQTTQLSRTYLKSKVYKVYKDSKDYNGDGQDDILWRYYGPGGFNVVWYMGYSGGGGIQPALQSLGQKGTLGADFIKDKKSGVMRVINIQGGKAPDQIFQDPREVGGLLGKAVWTSADMTIPPGVRMVTDPRQGPARPRSRVKGTTFLGSATLYQVPDATWEIGATGDFNGDGKTDILWRYNGPGGYNVVWYLDGVTFLDSAVFPAVTDPTWKMAGAGDFNGDGKPDILWRYNATGGYNIVWYLDGVNLIGSAALDAVTDPTWGVEGIGDFNGDGKTDILWRYNGPGGYNILWHMNGVTKADYHVLDAVTDPTWKIGVLGDFNNDGKLDILWRYYGAGGYNVVWFMNDSVRLWWEAVNPVTDPAWRIQNH